MGRFLVIACDPFGGFCTALLSDLCEILDLDAETVRKDSFLVLVVCDLLQ